MANQDHEEIERRQGENRRQVDNRRQFGVREGLTGTETDRRSSGRRKDDQKAK